MRKPRRERKPRLAGLAAGLLSLGLVAAACGGGGGGGASGGGGGGGGANKSEPITIGYITWDEDVAVTHLWKYLLEERGYTVEMTQVDVAPLFAGMAQGDLDVFFDTWLPQTHEQYWNQYGDQLEKLGTWYDQATLEVAVPKYAPIDSLEQLPQYASKVDGKIIGIEAGAGLTAATKDQVIPQYNLGNQYTLVTSSTPSMLASLQKATNNKKPIVVTLWHPHWAYAAFPIKDLKDPKGALGGAEEIVTTARGNTDDHNAFSQDYPQASKWFRNFKLTDAQLASLENLVVREYKDNPQQGVKKWVNQNQDVIKQWVGGSSG